MQDLAAHELEFTNTLVENFGPAWKSLSPEAQVMQRNRFQEEALQYQRGCLMHFKTSSNRLRRDGSLVPIALQDTFDHVTNVMLSIHTTTQEYNEAVTRLRTEFPTIKDWLKWWLRPTIASMIFPACSKMSTDLASQIPTTTNPIEAQHSLLHDGAGIDHELGPGIQRLYLHVDKLHVQYQAIKGKFFCLSWMHALNTSS